MSYVGQKYFLTIVAWGMIEIASLITHESLSRATFRLQNDILQKIIRHSITWKEYRVILNFSFMEMEESGSDTLSAQLASDVTLVTQCSVNNLHHIIESLQRWSGPMSIAVFAPGDHISHAVMGSFFIKRCFPERNISFQIVYPVDNLPKFKAESLRIWHNYYYSDKRTIHCKHLLVTLQGLKGKNYALGDIPYPHNTLRNVAKKAVKTRYMFLLDVDIMPSRKVREIFLNHLYNMKSRKDATNTTVPQNVVFVTPAFEIEESVSIPTTKQELAWLYKNGMIRAFHAETCPMCHKPTRYEDWLGVSDTEVTAFEVEWSQSWEPFYISHVNVPEHDERFKQYGYDRISQVCELYVSGHSFVLLANAFVVHKGLKSREKFHSKKNEENRKNWILYTKLFKPDLKLKYLNSTRECVETSKREGKSRVNFNPHMKRSAKVIFKEKPADRDL
ncbi:unnamed protein product [Clavelina lepadiformis]|uniref:Beta-1,4-glucuronyltransferase 1 n=1 Tax=Clavelina lepadiformis TaxID=159417 RepID=A0ABP0G0X7_CLALP